LFSEIGHFQCSKGFKDGGFAISILEIERSPRPTASDKTWVDTPFHASKFTLTHNKTTWNQPNHQWKFSNVLQHSEAIGPFPLSRVILMIVCEQPGKRKIYEIEQGSISFKNLKPT
jgi:hypothetical protein